MRLYEFLFEAPLPKIELPGELPVDAWHKGDAGSEYTNLGKGVEAMVVKDPTDPGVIKIIGSKVSLRISAYMQYILIARNYAKQNPYLPRVESIQHEIVPPEKYVTTAFFTRPIKEYFVVRLEELVPIQKASVKEISFMARMVFKNEDFEYSFGDEYQPQRDVMDAFVRSLHLIIKAKRLPKVVDKNFLAVIRLIGKIVHSTRGYTDIHADNLMMRRTPYGPQLVITDPVYRGVDPSN